MAINKNEVAKLAAAPAHCTIDGVRAAVAGLDLEQATRLMFARAQSGQSMPIELVAEVYPKLTYAPHAAILIAIAEGERAGVLVQLLEELAFPDDDIGWALGAVTAYAAWHLCPTDDMRARIAVQARLLALRCRWSDGDALPLLRALAANLGDDLLTALVSADASGIGSTVVAQLIPVVLALPRAIVIRENALPIAEAGPVAQAAVAATIEQERRLIGRNESCPCGSGKKFKRCHGATSASEPMLDLEALVERPKTPARIKAAPRGECRTVQDVQMLPLTELTKLRWRKLEILPLLAVLDRLLKYRAWRLAEPILVEIDSREQIRAHEREQFRMRFLMRALACRQFELVKKHVRGIRSKGYLMLKPTIGAAVALAERAPDALDQLLAALERVVRDETDAEAINLATMLEATAPGLALVLLRASTNPDRAVHADTVLVLADQLRARLGLPPGDPVRAVYEALKTAQARKLDDAARARAASAAAAETEALRAALKDAKSEARTLERHLADAQQQTREARPASPRSEREAEPAEVQTLRMRIDELQAMIRERNGELAELRRRLEREEVIPATPPSLTAPQDDDEGWEAEDERERRVLVPIWTTSATAALATVPPHVAREAVRTTGELASGSPAPWRAVKRPRGLAATLLMARIGIHHRLLFSIEPAGLTAQELVTREALALTLKRYAGRASRSRDQR